MNSNGILHFTVNAQGRLVLHESPGDAVSQKSPGDVVVSLALNAYQIRCIQRAERLAREKQGSWK